VVKGPSVVKKMLIRRVVLFLLVVATHSVRESTRVLLEDVKALTFHKDRLTTGNRSPRIPQIECVGGTAHCEFIPDVIQCYNMGSDGSDMQWKCEAEMGDAYRFGPLSVNCEGFNYPTDPYVLRGSCSIRFNIDLTEKGKGLHKDQRRQYTSSITRDGWNLGFSRFLQIFAVMVIGYAIYRICFPSGIQWGSGRSPISDWSSDWSSSQPGSSVPPPTTPQSNLGFWSGAGLGGTLGYLLGKNRAVPRANTQTIHSDEQRPSESREGTSRTATGYGETTRR